MHPRTAHRHTNVLWIFLGIIFCALFLVFSLPKTINNAPTGAQIADFNRLVVSGVTPDSVLTRGELVQLDILGSGFAADASVVFSNQGISVLSARVVSSTRIKVDLVVSAAAPLGPVSVLVKQGSDSSYLDGLEVVQRVRR